MNFSMPKRDYLMEVKANNTPSTFKTYQSMLNRYERWLAAEGQPDADLEYALAVQTLTRFKYSLSRGIKKDGPLLGQSVRSVMCPLKGMCGFLIRMKVMHENPFDLIDLPKKVDPVRLRVSDKEVEALMVATERQRDPRRVALSRLVLSTLIHAGVRADEFQNIEIGHIDVEQETLEVRHGKGDKSRLLHPPRQYWVAYKGWQPFRDAMTCQHPYLFALGPRTHMNDESLRKHLEEIKAIAGLADAHNIMPHRLRGWFATHMHENGATVPHVQEALGHSHPQTTLAYLYANGKGAQAMKQCASFGPVGWGGGEPPALDPDAGGLPAKSRQPDAPVARDRARLHRNTTSAQRTGTRPSTPR